MTASDRVSSVKNLIPKSDAFNSFDSIDQFPFTQS